MTSLTAVELNYLVYRYLLESGFGRAAWNFSVEAGIDKPMIAINIIPTGALIEMVVMGLLFKERQANASNGDDEENFCFLKPMELITKDMDVLQKIVKKELMKKSIDRSMDQGSGSKGAKSPETLRGKNENRNVAGSKDPIRGILKTPSKNAAGPKDPDKGNEGSSSGKDI